MSKNKHQRDPRKGQSKRYTFLGSIKGGLTRRRIAKIRGKEGHCSHMRSTHPQR